MIDYIESYKLLKIHCNNVVPHLCIGFGNELRAIKLLGHIGFDEIVFLVLIPNKHFKHADIDNVAGLIRKTRELFPKKKISLGCMRPGGKYRRDLDIKVLPYVDKIVKPASNAVRYAAENKYKIKEKNECCAFTLDP